MFLKILSVGVFACLFFVVHCGNVKEKFTLRRDGLRPSDESILEKYFTTSLMECMALCSYQSWCKSASFKPPTQHCWLGINDITHDVHADALLVKKGAKWITMAKTFYTIFQRVHSNGHYMATYDDAVALCNEMNTVVASESDLLASKALGLEYCSCGWLSNQKIGYIWEDTSTQCLEGLATQGNEIIYCDSLNKANVWCRL